MSSTPCRRKMPTSRRPRRSRSSPTISTERGASHAACSPARRSAGAREPILKCGARDGPLARESGTVYPPSAPFVHGEENEIWLYYHGNNLLHGERTRDGAAPSQGLYLAKIPRDRLVCLKPGDEHEEAVVTTVPLALSDALRLNVEVQDGGEVYVTRQTGRLPGQGNL